MRTLYLSFLLLLSFPLLAQWQGDTANFEIFPDSLHLNDNGGESSISYISRPSNIIEEATWEFTVQIKQGTSSSNLAYVYLVSDVAELDANGYYVQIGNTADEVSLYRQDGGSSTVIIDGIDKRIDTKPMIVTVKVTRSTDGVWELYSKLDSETDFVKEGEVNDVVYLSSAYFGVKAKYTSTRALETDFYNFNISGSSFTDNVSPRLDSVVCLTQYQCLFYFNELINVNNVSYDGTSADEVLIDGKTVKVQFTSPFVKNDSSLISYSVSDTSANTLSADVKVYYTPFEIVSVEMLSLDTLAFRLNKSTSTVQSSNITLDGVHPSNVALINDLWIANFANPISPRINVDLVIEGILDLNGDILQPYNEDISYFTPTFGDVVFNELMPDPNPVIANLPEAEYIELYNTSGFSINLEDWSFIKDDKSYSFPPYQMESGDYLLITTTNMLDAFPSDINIIALSSFPTLNNSGMSLQLTSSKGDLIDLVDYDDSWHESYKSDGGFSLERIDVYNPSQIDNWTSSCSENGGTPGKQNCVAADNPDYDAPYIVNAYALDNSWIMLNLSEPLLSSEVSLASSYLFSGSQDIASIVPLGDLAMTEQVMLELSDSMLTGTVYTLEVSNLQDLSGNIMETSTHNIAYCRLPETSEIIINEIMYAPLTGEAEYVEIYNNTAVPFDLSQLKITQQDDDGTWGSGKQISDLPHLLLPHAYLALSGDAVSLSEQYSIESEAVTSVSSMPSLGNESDNIALLLTNARVIDVLYYSDDWQSPLLNDTKGVALERVSADVETNVSDNWFSASSLVNYGTPGAVNSQQKSESTTSDAIAVSPEVFTPDNDGNEDFTTLHIDNKYEGGTIRVQVFNHRGIAIKELINNALIASYSDIRWDGTDNDGARCPMGPYIIWVEIVTPQGEVVTKKIECVVSVRMR